MKGTEIHEAFFHTNIPFSSAPLNRNMTGRLVASLEREITSRTSKATATLTPLSLAPVRIIFLNTSYDFKNDKFTLTYQGFRKRCRNER